jgi:hypothetical protein
MSAAAALVFLDEARRLEGSGGLLSTAIDSRPGQAATNHFHAPVISRWTYSAGNHARLRTL